MMSRGASLVLSGFIAVACSGDVTGVGPLERQVILRELERNERKWAAQAFEDYRYEFRMVCECSQAEATAVEIEVRDGSVVRVRKLSNGEELPPDPDAWPTVEGLFDEIRLALEEGVGAIDVRYEPVFGYPLEVDIWWSEEAIQGVRLFAAELMPLLELASRPVSP